MDILLSLNNSLFRKFIFILGAVALITCAVHIYECKRKIPAQLVGVCYPRFYKDFTMPYPEFFTSKDALQKVLYQYEHEYPFTTLMFDENDYVFSHHAPIKYFEYHIFGDECSSFMDGNVIEPIYDTIRTECTYIYCIKPKNKYRLPCP